MVSGSTPTIVTDVKLFGCSSDMLKDDTLSVSVVSDFSWLIKMLSESSV